MGIVTPIFVFSSLNINRGGLTKAVMRRANAMTQHFNDVIILTLQYQRNYHDIIRKVRDSGEINEDVSVKNLYIELDPYKNNSPVNELSANHSIEENGLLAIKDEKENSYHYYQDGLYVKNKKFDRRGMVYLIDYFNESRQKVRCEEFDGKGYLVRIKVFDPIKNKPSLYRYFSKNGKCFLTEWVNPETEAVTRCQLFFPEIKEFENLTELYTYWVNQEVKNVPHPVLMSDSRGLPSDQVLLNIPSELAGKVAIAHNNHFNKPYRKGSGYAPGWNTLLDNLDKFDRVVLLTEEQMEDLVEDFGAYDNFCVIPHEAKKLPETTTEIKREPHLAVALVRLKEQKRVDEAIRAFVHVVQKIPDARFEIYGKGPLEKELQELIDELGMGEHIKLMGYTQETVSCYKKAACMILSSDFEGSPLVFNECMAAGTPVVAYDFKYGARDVVRDGVDGFVVSRGDQEALAEKVITIMENPKLREKMSKQAMEITKRYSYERYINNWVQLFNEVGKGKGKQEDNKTTKKRTSFLSKFLKHKRISAL